MKTTDLRAGAFRGRVAVARWEGFRRRLASAYRGAYALAMRQPLASERAIHSTQRWSAHVLGALGLLLLGCPAGSSTQQATTFSGQQKRAELLCPRAGAERVDVSSWRGTGRPDVARIYQKDGSSGQATLSCREVDLNGDGRKDMLVFFAADGKKLREEFDQDYDGLADVKSFYEDGVLVRQELDINYDGKADLVQTMESGKVVRVEKLWTQSAAAEDKPSGPSKAESGTASSAAAK